ncbi:MAG: class I SAM-dependent methyltransferase [Chloroflexi bacterium]|nr:class I SAM-dependent methyltransferase [Chloroflexota bacterium]
MGEFDFDTVFDADDYLYFYEPVLTDERSEREADLVWRLLHLEPGAEVLDLACGHGRIANRLAGRGAHVTGVDRSAGFLARARADAHVRGVAVDYIEGDMRTLPWEARFDAAFNWFTAFGYHDDATDRAVLAGIRRTLRPGGRFAIDHVNRDRLLASFRPASLIERGDDLMLDSSAFDLLSGRIETDRITVRGGHVRRAHFSVRLLTAPELREWLAAAGFVTIEFVGVDGESFSAASRRMIAVAGV